MDSREQISAENKVGQGWLKNFQILPKYMNCLLSAANILQFDKQPHVLVLQSSPGLGPTSLFFDQKTLDISDVSEQGNSDEDVAEITNFLVVQESAGTPTTPKHWRAKASSTTTSAKGDIRTSHLAPKSNASFPVVADDTAMASVSANDLVSPSSPASLPILASASSLPDVIDLTSEPLALANAKRPVGKPKKITAAGRSENDAPSKPPVGKFPQRPVGHPRKLEAGIKRPIGRPRKPPIPAGVQVVLPIRRPVGLSRKNPITITPPTPANDVVLAYETRTEPNSTISLSDPTGSLASETEAGDALIQPEVNDLVEALSSAFSQNANQDSGSRREFASGWQDYDLVGALSSAFANNAIPDTDDESSATSSDPGSETIPHSEFPTRRRRRRLALKRVPQIPSSPVKRLRPKRTPKALYIPPNEKAIEAYLDIEYLPVELPLGISVAPENESEYVDPDDEVLLDYDSSSEIIEKRTKQEQQKLNHSSTTLRNNLRFLFMEKVLSCKAPKPTPIRQYTISTASSTTAYVSRVEEHCGDRALSEILDGLPSWEANIKPRTYFRRRATFDEPSSERGISEISSQGEETEDSVVETTKRSYSEEDSVPRKRVKFSDTVSVGFQSGVEIDAANIQTKFDVVLCGESLQKLVKGKEIELVLSFFATSTLEHIIRKSQVVDGDELDFLSTDNLQACKSIWQALQYISESAPGALGLPGIVEGTLIWEARKLVHSMMVAG
ncbi:hypothetical protein BT96DRAFT_942605 [Gymnopus androsaceus JB14]|uniref:Uncharacterized protein n=1 Tax=Gymnopus androsaceus JB14 TaxID=1447944 RepID=A0A6A4HCZ7_9AGAR|nr:hypothetical protein BT96DRAFT_942605 [Gymnopus androsaceus JB14]